MTSKSNRSGFTIELVEEVALLSRFCPDEADHLQYVNFSVVTEDQIIKSLKNTYKAIAKDKEQSLLQRTVKSEKDLNEVMVTIEQGSSMKSKILHSQEIIRVECKNRQIAEENQRRAEKRVEILFDHVEKLVKALMHESLSKEKVIERLQEALGEIKSQEETIANCKRVTSTQAKYIHKAREQNNTLENQLKLMEEKYSEIKLKYSYLKDFQRQQYCEAVETADNLRSKFVLLQPAHSKARLDDAQVFCPHCGTELCNRYGGCNTPLITESNHLYNQFAVVDETSKTSDLDALTASQIDQVIIFIKSCCMGGDATKDISLKELDSSFKKYHFAMANEHNENTCRGLMGSLDFLLKVNRLTVSQWFKFADVGGAIEGEGKVTYQELLASISKLCKSVSQPDWNKQDVLQLLRYMDPSADNELSLAEAELAFRRFRAPPEYQEIISAATPIIGKLDSFMKSKRIRVVDLFKAIDTNRDGLISLGELSKTLEDMFGQRAANSFNFESTFRKVGGAHSHTATASNVVSEAPVAKLSVPQLSAPWLTAAQSSTLKEPVGSGDSPIRRPRSAGYSRNYVPTLKPKVDHLMKTDEEKERDMLLGTYKLINLSKSHNKLSTEKLDEMKKLDKLIKKIYFKNEKTREVVISKEEQIFQLAYGKR